MRRHKLKPVRKFERLEDRRLMAGDIDLDNGILTIEGTNNHDEILVNYKLGEPDEVLVTIRNRLTGAVLEQEDYDLEDVEKIVAHGLNGNDYLLNTTDLRAELYGGNGDDYLYSQAGNDKLDGGANNDTLIGGGGNDELIGGSGSDRYIFSGTLLGTDTVSENASLDTDVFDFANFSGKVNLNLANTLEQVVNATHLRLRLTSATGIENVIGSQYEDTISGNARNNEILGLGANDTLSGGDGADILRGGEGNDFLQGGSGNDRLYGDGGKDSLWGDLGNDELFGGDGDDYLLGGFGADNLDGGAGNDTLVGGEAEYAPPSALKTPRDRLTGGPGQDTFISRRLRLQSYATFEDILDYNSAVDVVFTQWY